MAPLSSIDSKSDISQDLWTLSYLNEILLAFGSIACILAAVFLCGCCRKKGSTKEVVMESKKVIYPSIKSTKEPSKCEESGSVIMPGAETMLSVSDDNRGALDHCNIPVVPSSQVVNNLDLKLMSKLGTPSPPSVGPHASIKQKFVISRTPSLELMSVKQQSEKKLSTSPMYGQAQMCLNRPAGAAKSPNLAGGTALGQSMIKRQSVAVNEKEFDDARDAEDAAHYMNGKELCGERVIVELTKRPPKGRDAYRTSGTRFLVEQYGRGPPSRSYGGGYSGGGGGGGGGGGYSRSPRRRDDSGAFPHPTQTRWRVIVENLSSRVSWQDLKDFMRTAGEVCYSDAHRIHKNEGVVCFTNESEMRRALAELNGKELQGRKIKLVDGSRRSSSPSSRSRSRSRSASGSRSRSRSPSRGKRHSSDSRSRSRSPRSRSPRERSHSGDRKSGSKRPHSRSVDSRSKSRSRSGSPGANGQVKAEVDD